MRPCARYVRRRCFCAWLTWMCEMNRVSTSRPFTCVPGAQPTFQHLASKFAWNSIAAYSAVDAVRRWTLHEACKAERTSALLSAFFSRFSRNVADFFGHRAWPLVEFSFFACVNDTGDGVGGKLGIMKSQADAAQHCLHDTNRPAVIPSCHVSGCCWPKSACQHSFQALRTRLPPGECCHTAMMLMTGSAQKHDMPYAACCRPNAMRRSISGYELIVRRRRVSHM